MGPNDLPLTQYNDYLLFWEELLNIEPIRIRNGKLAVEKVPLTLTYIVLPRN